MHSCPHAISHSAQDCGENLTYIMCFVRISHLNLTCMLVVQCITVTRPRNWLRDRLRSLTYNGVYPCKYVISKVLYFIFGMLPNQ